MPNQHPTVETIEIPDATTFAIGAIVRLHPHYVSDAMGKIIFRVTAVPDPAAKRKAQREGYGLTPIEGGQGVAAEPFMLVEGSDEDKAKAARTTPVERFLPGSVVTARGLRGVGLEERLVVTAMATGGTYTLYRLGGGEGEHWSKIPGKNLRRVDVTAL